MLLPSERLADAVTDGNGSHADAGCGSIGRFYMFALPLRRRRRVVQRTTLDPAPDAETVVEDRPATPPLSLEKLVPEIVDPSLLRVRDNLSGE
jgi:hypothetical protein